MSSCEKCWSDARNGAGSVVEEYQLLLIERHPGCTPEQQAGKHAGECPECKRRTIHQITREPMCGCEVASLARKDKK